MNGVLTDGNIFYFIRLEGYKVYHCHPLFREANLKEIVQYMVVSMRGESLFATAPAPTSTVEQVVKTVSSSPHGTRTEIVSKRVITTTEYPPEALLL